MKYTEDFKPCIGDKVYAPIKDSNQLGVCFVENIISEETVVVVFYGNFYEQHTDRLIFIESRKPSISERILDAWKDIFNFILLKD